MNVIPLVKIKYVPRVSIWCNKLIVGKFLEQIFLNSSFSMGFSHVQTTAKMKDQIELYLVMVKLVSWWLNWYHKLFFGRWGRHLGNEESCRVIDLTLVALI